MERYRKRLAEDAIENIQGIRIVPGASGLSVVVICKRPFVSVALHGIEAQIVFGMPDPKIVKGKLEHPGMMIPPGKRGKLHASTASRIRSHEYLFTPDDLLEAAGMTNAYSILILMGDEKWSFRVLAI